MQKIKHKLHKSTGKRDKEEIEDLPKKPHSEKSTKKIRKSKSSPKKKSKDEKPTQITSSESDKNDEKTVENPKVIEHPPVKQSMRTLSFSSVEKAKKRLSLKRDKTIVTIEISIIFQSVNNLPSKYNGKKIFVQWKTGHRSSTRGKIASAPSENGKVNWKEDSSHITLPLKFDLLDNDILDSKILTLYLRNDTLDRSIKKSHRIGKIRFNLSPFAAHDQKTNHSLSLGRSNNTTLSLLLSAKWIKLNNKILKEPDVTSGTLEQKKKKTVTLSDNHEYELHTDAGTATEGSIATDLSEETISSDDVDETDEEEEIEKELKKEHVEKETWEHVAKRVTEEKEALEKEMKALKTKCKELQAELIDKLGKELVGGGSLSVEAKQLEVDSKGLAETEKWKKEAEKAKKLAEELKGENMVLKTRLEGESLALGRALEDNSKQMEIIKSLEKAENGDVARENVFVETTPVVAGGQVGKAGSGWAYKWNAQSGSLAKWGGALAMLLCVYFVLFVFLK